MCVCLLYDLSSKTVLPCGDGTQGWHMLCSFSTTELHLQPKTVLMGSILMPSVDGHLAMGLMLNT